MKKLVPEIVSEIIEDVRVNGDIAVKRICERIGDKPPRELTPDEIKSACNRLTADRKEVIDFAAANIRKFADAIMQTTKQVEVAFDGYSAGMRFAPVERAACYVPGGRYPLPSTALMTTITALVAGVREIYVMGPALTDEVIYAGTIGGATRFFQIGGAQAVAAAAFGTASIPRADIIAGPGNAYVAEAKRQLIGTVGIDMLAGPSEIAVVGDGTADPELLIADLLSQAEHDPDAKCYLLVTTETVAQQVKERLPQRVQERREQLPDFIDESVSKIDIETYANVEQCAHRSNEIAPEHLLLHLQNAKAQSDLFTNYGALFIGANSTVPYGDYCAGPNHTLPTGGTARFSGGLTPLTFLRTQTWLDVPKPCAQLSDFTARFAEIEGLHAHAKAARLREQSSSAGVT
jgi:histidinol dehydrogenase